MSLPAILFYFADLSGEEAIEGFFNADRHNAAFVYMKHNSHQKAKQKAFVQFSCRFNFEKL